MVWKSLLLAIMAVGVLAEFKLTDEQREKINEALREECKKVGAEDKVDDVMNSITTFIDCVQTLIDEDALKKEIQDASRKGELTDVFKKYCAKSPQLKFCINALLDGVTPCLDESSRVYIAASNNATSELLDFVCYKDGERIASFIAEGGPQCIQEKSCKIRDCAMKIKEIAPRTVEDAKSMTSEEKCAKFDELTTCVVLALQECSAPVAGNMAESVFQYARNGISCTKKT